MSDISTEQIQAMTTVGERLNIAADRQRAFFEREIGISETLITLSGTHRAAIEAIASACIRSFGTPEPTQVARRHGIATLLARVDCTITPNGIGLFECEERPAGIGITHTLLKEVDGRGITPSIVLHFEKLADGLPVVLRHPAARPNDDSFVFDVRTLEGTVPRQSVMARGEPEQLQEHPLLEEITDRSVSTVLSKGNKAYLLAIPEAQATAASADGIAPDRPFVLKPAQGSKARGVAVYLPPAERVTHGHHGVVSFERARRMVAGANAGELLLQQFLPPIPTATPEAAKANTILRILTLANPDGTCQAIGGTYVTRPELVVHGATNAICGVVRV